MCILVLTENVFNEQPFYDNLQRLNYEVFTSFELLKYWRKYQNLATWLELFSVVIVSETISDATAEQLISSLNRLDVIFLRKLDQVPTETEAQELLAKGYSAWLSSQASLAEIREALFTYRERTSLASPSNNQIEHSNIKIWDLLRMSLPTIDQKILRLLIKSGMQPVRREELIQEIWQTSPTNSNLSQLSFRIGRLKQNISEMFGIKQAIVTDWRVGYHLSQECYQLFTKADSPV